jgi:MraZ protein
VVWWNKFQLRTVKYHAINWSSERRGTQGQQDTPNQNQKKSRLHTGTRFFPNQEIRRASEQTSPQMARAVGHPATRDKSGGLNSGSSSTRRFSILGVADTRGGADEGTEGLGRRFRGEYTFKVDAKGRVSIPAPFRRVIEAEDPEHTEGGRPQFIIVYGEDSQEFLEGYTIAEAQALEEKINRLPNSPLKRRLVNEKITLSLDSELDPDGRLVMPQRLREKIGLQGEAVFIGTLNTFRIWTPEGYARHKAAESNDLGFGIAPDTDLLDALDIVLGRQDGG